jgi:hypothetical protein
MVLEIYKLAMPSRLFVFVATQNAERLGAFGSVLQDLGAKFVGPQVFSFVEDNMSPEAIGEALSSLELEQDECIYVIGTGSKGFESYGIVAPRSGGGIVVEGGQRE